MEQSASNEQYRSGKHWTEAELLVRLQRNGVWLPPAELKLVENSPIFPSKSNRSIQVDGIMEVTYRGRTQRYVIEVKNRSTPQVLQNAIAQARHLANLTNMLPLVVVPYLSAEALTSLEEEEVSGVDLSGNGVILAPDFTVWRSGQQNRYPEIQTVRNLYRGVSSIFVRCFLLRADFSSLKELREYALSRLDQDGTRSISESKLAMGTASKVVQQLQEELLVRRDGHRLRAVDTARLMDGLRTNYHPSKAARLAGKTMVTENDIWQRLAKRQAASVDGAMTWRYAATGLGSAARYRVLSGPDKLSIYVTDLDSAADLIEMRATRVFPNVELIEDTGSTAYFDARHDGAEVWASPIQTWLELMAGGPRERDAAQTLEAALLESRGEQLT